MLNIFNYIIENFIYFFFVFDRLFTDLSNSAGSLVGLRHIQVSMMKNLPRTVSNEISKENTRVLFISIRLNQTVSQTHSTPGLINTGSAYIMANWR